METSRTFFSRPSQPPRQLLAPRSRRRSVSILLSNVYVYRTCIYIGTTGMPAANNKTLSCGFSHVLNTFVFLPASDVLGYAVIPQVFGTSVSDKSPNRGARLPALFSGRSFPSGWPAFRAGSFFLYRVSINWRWSRIASNPVFRRICKLPETRRTRPNVILHRYVHNDVSATNQT